MGWGVKGVIAQSGLQDMTFESLLRGGEIWGRGEGG